MHSSNIKFNGPIDILLHQCSACGYLSALRHNMARHVKSKCIAARIISEDVRLFPKQSDGDTCSDKGIIAPPLFAPAPQPIPIPKIVIVPHGSAEDMCHMRRTLSPDFLRRVSSFPPEEIPAYVFSHVRGTLAPARHRTVIVTTSRIALQYPDRITTVSKKYFIARMVKELLDSLLELRGDLFETLTQKTVSHINNEMVSAYDVMTATGACMKCCAADARNIRRTSHSKMRVELARLRPDFFVF